MAGQSSMLLVVVISIAKKAVKDRPRVKLMYSHLVEIRAPYNSRAVSVMLSVCIREIMDF